jgi:D-alanyl-D-alanine carboxypeptidase/D-alanyl-D-alanine-endopeptidase (penicillin-binding protein 4)
VIENLWQLLDRLRGFGIRDIRGDLVLDKTPVRAAGARSGQFDGEEGRAYNVGP